MGRARGESRGEFPWEDARMFICLSLSLSLLSINNLRLPTQLSNIHLAKTSTWNHQLWIEMCPYVRLINFHYYPN